MNIFIFDLDHIKNAKAHCDQHLVSGLKEVVQMMACAFPLEALKKAPLTQKGDFRKHGYYNHPCTKWMRENLANFMWSVKYWYCLEEERRWRFPNRSDHFSTEFIEWAIINIENTDIQRSSKITLFATAFTEGSVARFEKDIFGVNSVDDVVNLYRTYLSEDKKFAVWTRREKPVWIK
jgi:hypothetical protein